MSVVVGSALLAWGYFVSGYWQALLMGVGTTLTLVAILVALESSISARVSDEIRGLAPIHVYEAAIRMTAGPAETLTKAAFLQSLHRDLSSLGLSPVVPVTLGSRHYTSSTYSIEWSVCVIEAGGGIAQAEGQINRGQEDALLIRSIGLRMRASIDGEELVDKVVPWRPGEYLLDDSEASGLSLAYDQITRRIGAELLKRQ